MITNITIKKLKSLKTKCAFRKVARMLEEREIYLKQGKSIDVEKILELILFLQENATPQGTLSRLTNHLLPLQVSHPLPDTTPNSSNQPLCHPLPFCPTQRQLFLLRAAIDQEVGIAPSDWDFSIVQTTQETPSPPLDMKLFLEDLRSPFNVGAIFRSASAFGVSKILLTESCPSLEHPRTLRSAMGCLSNIKSQRLTFEERLPTLETLASQGRLFALELGGTEIQDFHFPKGGVAILGSEELGVSPQLLELAQNSAGRVSIPLYGEKGSLNVGVATGILLSYWSTFCKR